jgi:uncharacterized membrane protein YdfJ with MMPL/SSD domain
MPANFFSIAWPLVIAIILLAGLIVSIAAITTLITAITRARQITRESQAQEGTEAVDQSNHPSRKSSHHTDFSTGQEPGVLETITTDGIHFIPVP